MMRKGQYMVKLDLKSAFWHVPIWEKHKKLLRFRWMGKLYQMEALPFGLSAAPRLFTKLLKTPMSLIRRLGILICIYLDDMLILSDSYEEAIRARDAVIFILQNLGFTINWEKSVIIPTTTLEFLGFILDSINMEIGLSPEKAKSLISLCRRTMSLEQIPLRELASLIGKLHSTCQAILLAPMQVRNLQKVQAEALRINASYETMITLDVKCKSELSWWTKNLQLLGGRKMRIEEPDLILYSDASTSQGWGAATESGTRTGGQWTREERERWHINTLELIACERAIMALSKNLNPKHILIYVDNQVALSYLNKMGGKNPHMTSIAKRIWNFAMLNGFVITGLWIPSGENKLADEESRRTETSADWALDSQTFTEITRALGDPSVDAFASLTMHQLPKYWSWKPDPLAQGTDALIQDWRQEFPYIFPPLCLMGRILSKIQRQRVERAILIAPIWQNQTWFPKLIRMLIKRPIVLTPSPLILKNHQGEPHPLISQGRMNLAAFLVSGVEWRQRDFLETLPLSSSIVEEGAQRELTKPHGLNGLIGVIHNKLIHSTALSHIL